MNNLAENDSITKSAFKVMAGGVLSLTAGLINQILIAAFFGASAGMDAYLTALVIPAYFQSILSSSLSFAFIPAFIREKSSEKEEDAWSLVGTFFWGIVLILCTIAVVASGFSTQIIAISAPGFDQEKSTLAARMLSILMFTIPFTGLNSFTVGIQNARNRFFWPSLGGAVNSLSNAAVLLIFYHSLGPLALAWAYLASTIAQAGITIIPVIRHGWKKPLPLFDARVHEIGQLMIPLIIAGMLISFTPVAERYFASRLPEGQISYIGYAYKISNIFVALLAAGVASAIFPSMARSHIQDGISGLTEKTNYGLKLSFAIALPSILITSAVAVPLISTLFQRGAFTSVDTIGVSQILLAVLLSDVLFRMVGNVFIRNSYVLKDTLSPPIISSIAAVLYLVFGRFFVDRWGYSGLVWARTIQTGLYVFTLWAFLSIKWKYFYGMKMRKLVMEYFIAAAAAYLCSAFTISKLVFLPALPKLIIGALLGIGLYLLILYFRDRDMFNAVLEMAGAQKVYVLLQGFKTRSTKKLI